MKAYSGFLRLVLATFLLFPSLGQSEVDKVKPRLYMRPGWIFDMECQAKTGFKIEPAWQMELLKNVGEFQNAWDKYAGQLIQVSEEKVGRHFERSEYEVTLSVCNFVPMATPFIMTVKLYLESYKASKPGGEGKWSLDRFAILTHHELLHHLINNTENLEFRSFSKLAQKYKADTHNVLAHLHLMAIQKSVYEKIGRLDLVKESDKIYGYIGGDYARSWEIVNAEGPEPFLAELKLWNREKK